MRLIFTYFQTQHRDFGLHSIPSEWDNDSDFRPRRSLATCYLFLRIYPPSRVCVYKRSTPVLLTSLCTSTSASGLLLLNEYSIHPSVDHRRGRPQFVLCKWDIECLRRRAVAAQCTLLRAQKASLHCAARTWTRTSLGLNGGPPGHRTYRQLVVLILPTGQSYVALVYRWI